MLYVSDEFMAPPCSERLAEAPEIINTSVNITNNNPPPLNYDLRARIKSNVIFWFGVVLTTVIIPIVLYYPLVYRTQLDIGSILGIASISNGIPSTIQLPYRIWQLWKQDGGDRRPLSGKVMDMFMLEYIFAFVILAAIYIVSTSVPIP
jgi:hypothetical protein